MGYTTCYTLDVKHIKNEDQFMELRNMLDGKTKECMDVIGYALEKGCYHDGQASFDCWQDVKWYEHENDMKVVSQHFPDMVFCLHGEGETQGDVWDKYFHNGDCEACYAELYVPKPHRITWED